MTDKPLELPAVGYGCVHLSACRSEREAHRLLQTAYDNGIRLYDTAPLYGKGYSEWVLGRFLKKLSASDRTSISITTKYGLGPLSSPSLSPVAALPLNYIWKRFTSVPKKSPAPQAESIPPIVKKSHRMIDVNRVKQQFEQSLKRLGVMQIQTYLGHELTPSFLSDEACRYLESLIVEGRVSRLGVGIGANHLLAMDPNEMDGFEVLQYNADVPDHADELLKRFPEKRHLHHSIMKSMKKNGGSHRLYDHRNRFPSCTVLFSSSNPKHIAQNGTEFSQYHAAH